MALFLPYFQHQQGCHIVDTQNMHQQCGNNLVDAYFHQEEADLPFIICFFILHTLGWCTMSCLCNNAFFLLAGLFVHHSPEKVPLCWIYLSFGFECKDSKLHWEGGRFSLIWNITEHCVSRGHTVHSNATYQSLGKSTEPPYREEKHMAGELQ